MSVVRVLFLGTPDFAVSSLEQLCSDEHFEVTGVITQPDRPAGRKQKMQFSSVKAWALEKSLKVLTPEKINEEAVLTELKSFNADIAVVVAYGQILPQEFLDIFPFGAVNIHSSLLPRWRGAAPIQRAIMFGDKETGVSLQKIVLKLDAGDVLGERKILITDSLNAIELHDQLKVMAKDLLAIELMDFIRGNLAGKPQDEELVTYAKKLEKSEGLIDWSLSAEEIHNKIKGLSLGPKTWSFYQGKKIKILKTEVLEAVDSTKASTVGEIIKVEKNELIINCGKGSLKVLQVQAESKSKMDIEPFLRGNKISVGDKFE